MSIIQADIPKRSYLQQCWIDFWLQNFNWILKMPKFLTASHSFWQPKNSKIVQFLLLFHFLPRSFSTQHNNATIWYRKNWNGEQFSCNVKKHPILKEKGIDSSLSFDHQLCCCFLTEVGSWGFVGNLSQSPKSVKSNACC